jgi:hypothetical protein
VCVCVCARARWGAGGMGAFHKARSVVRVLEEAGKRRERLDTSTKRSSTWSGGLEARVVDCNKTRHTTPLFISGTQCLSSFSISIITYHAGRDARDGGVRALSLQIPPRDFRAGASRE